MSQPRRHALLAVNPGHSRPIYEVLRRAGYSVTACWSGLDALRVLDEQDDVCLVVAETNLPGVGGFALVRQYLASDLEGRAVLFQAGSGEMPRAAFPRLTVLMAGAPPEAVLSALPPAT
ncbi:MAG: hypothetical protein ACOZNI_19785 [Myxococcota bacterium]